MRTPKFHESGIGPAVRPRHNALAGLCLFVKRFKPTRRITFSKKLRRQFPRSASIPHNSVILPRGGDEGSILSAPSHLNEVNDVATRSGVRWSNTAQESRFRTHRRNNYCPGRRLEHRHL